MKKGQKVAHTKGCRNPRCRGICKKQLAYIQKSKQSSDNMVLMTGSHRPGKSTAAFRFFQNPNGVAWDFSEYEKLKLSSRASYVRPSDIKACRLCGGAIWLQPAGRERSYTTKAAWYHVGRYPRISCARAPTTKEPDRPLGAGP